MLEADPGLVEGKGSIHLDVGLLDGGPGAHGVEGDDEGEGAAGEVIGAARDGEADFLAGNPGALDDLAQEGGEHLHLVLVSLSPERGSLREGDDGHVAHQRCSW